VRKTEVKRHFLETGKAGSLLLCRRRQLQRPYPEARYSNTWSRPPTQ